VYVDGRSGAALAGPARDHLHAFDPIDEARVREFATHGQGDAVRKAWDAGEARVDIAKVCGGKVWRVRVVGPRHTQDTSGTYGHGHATAHTTQDYKRPRKRR